MSSSSAGGIAVVLLLLLLLLPVLQIARYATAAVLAGDGTCSFMVWQARHRQRAVETHAWPPPRQLPLHR